MSDHHFIEVKAEDGTQADAICEILEHAVQEVESAIPRHPSMSEGQLVHDMVNEDG